MPHERMTVFRNSPQQSIEVIVTEHETYQTPLLPGFELPLLALTGCCGPLGLVACLRLTV